MYTLIEIFDAKQYENILAPISLCNLKKIIFIGSHEVMTDKKTNDVLAFFKARKITLPYEFVYIERDNSKLALTKMALIVQQNSNCIFDATGGEDVILAAIGITAHRFDIPVIRVNTQTCEWLQLYGKTESLIFKNPKLTVSQAIMLQGGRIIRTACKPSFTEGERSDLFSLFEVNKIDCESYSAFCGALGSCFSHDKSTVSINKNEFSHKAIKYGADIVTVLKHLLDRRLLITTEESSTTLCARFSSPIVGMCLLKAGNILEVYSSLIASELEYNGTKLLHDINVGVSIDWAQRCSLSETQNEIDVLAMYKISPLFISCKNGEVRKESLYELDTVSRALGGSFAKRILVATYISKNQSSKEHFINRAHDMNISLIYDVHLKTCAQIKAELLAAL